MKPELKKLLLLNLPYLLFVYLFAKCGQAYRLAAGVDASAKLLHLTSGISAAFANPLPSLHPFDYHSRSRICCKTCKLCTCRICNGSISISPSCCSSRR